MVALERANQIRTEMADVRREIQHGTLTVSQALYDPRAQPMYLGRLLRAQPRWGDWRARDALHGLRDATWGAHVVELNIAMRLRDLTDRQRDALASWLA